MRPLRRKKQLRQMLQLQDLQEAEAGLRTSQVRNPPLAKAKGSLEQGVGELPGVSLCFTRPVREGVSKGEEDGRRPPALRKGHPPNGRKAVWGVSRPQGV
jgi:hypothetical protein